MVAHLNSTGRLIKVHHVRSISSLVLIPLTKRGTALGMIVPLRSGEVHRRPAELGPVTRAVDEHQVSAASEGQEIQRGFTEPGPVTQTTDEHRVSAASEGRPLPSTPLGPPADSGRVIHVRAGYTRFDFD